MLLLDKRSQESLSGKAAAPDFTPTPEFISKNKELNDIHMSSLKDFDPSFKTFVNETPFELTGSKSFAASCKVPLSSYFNQNPHNVDVNFGITYYSWEGGLSVGSDQFSLFVPRSVASSFEPKQEHVQQMSKSVYIGKSVSEFLLNSSVDAVNRNCSKMKGLIIKKIENDIKEIEKKGNWGEINNAGGIFAFCVKKLSEYLDDKEIESQLSAKERLTKDQKERVKASLKNLATSSISVTSWADNCGIPDSTDLENSEREILGNNAKLARNVSQFQSLFGLIGFSQRSYSSNNNTSIYYDSRNWYSGRGLFVLLSQANAHSYTVKRLFQSPNPIDAVLYSSLPLDKYMNNLLAADHKYGSNYVDSINTVLGHLDSIIGNLRSLCLQIQEHANKNKIDIDTAFNQLYQSDQNFKSLVDSTHAELRKFTFLYAISRAYGPGGTYSGKDDPSAVANTKFQSDVLPKNEIAGYMAMDYAVNYIGRGLDIIISSSKPLQKIDYFVDEKDSKVWMGVDNNPNKGRAEVTLQIKVDKKESLVVEDPSQMESDIKGSLEPVLKEYSAYIPKNGISFSENSDYRIYSVKIWRDFTINSESEANNTSFKIEIPSKLSSPSSPRITILELNSKISKNLPPISKTTYKEDQPGYFSLQLQGGLSSTSLSGTPKVLGRGGDLSNSSAKEDQLGFRNISTGSIIDLFSLAGYHSLTDFINARKATYYSDVNKSPYQWFSFDDIEKDCKDFHSKNASLVSDPQAYLSKWKKEFDSNVNNYISKGLGEPLKERLAKENDPYMKDVSPNFLDSIEEIGKWSPLHAKMTYWSVYKGSILRLMSLIDPNQSPESRALYNRLSEELNYASARYVSSAINEIVPNMLAGVRAQGDLYEAYMTANQAFLEQGLSTIVGFNLFGRENRLTIGISKGVGPSSDQTFTPVIIHQGSGLSAKIANGTGLVLDHLFNLYKYRDDKTLFRLDFHTQFSILSISNFRHYEFNAAVQSAWSEVFNTWSSAGWANNQPDLYKLVSQDFVNLINKLQNSLLADDTQAYEICSKLAEYFDPSNMDARKGNWDIEAKNLFFQLRDIVLSPRYLGGNWSDTVIAEGMYVNGLDQYIGVDHFAFPGPIFAPVIGLRFSFSEQKSSLFGLLPEDVRNKADLELNIAGEVFVPTIAVSSLASLFMDKKGVPYQIIEQSPQVFKNPIPPVLLRVDVNRITDITSWYAIRTGLYFAGNATGAKINNAGLYVKNLVKLPLSTTFYLDLKGKLTGTQLGSIMPGYEISAGTFTAFKNIEFGTQIYTLLRDHPYGYAKSWGINLNIRLLFGDQPNPIGPSLIQGHTDWEEWKGLNDRLYGPSSQKGSGN